MITYYIIGGSVVIILAMFTDASGTIKLVQIVISALGFGWICRKVVDTMNKDYGDYIRFASWSVAGVAAAKVVHNAVVGFVPIAEMFTKIQSSMATLQANIDKFANFIEKVTIWN